MFLLATTRLPHNKKIVKTNPNPPPPKAEPALKAAKPPI